MRVCQELTCNSDISHRHPSAKFCSDRCKGRFHDRVRQARPEHKARAAATTAMWRENNAERNRENIARWRKGNPDAKAAGTFRWQQANPGKVFQHSNRYRALRTGTETLEFTNKDWLRLLNRFGGCCAYCDKPSARLELEHVIPLSRGGRNAIGNYLPVCRSCNASKRDRLLVEWKRRPPKT